MNRLAVNIGDQFQSSLGRGTGIGDIISNIISIAFVLAGIIFLFLLVGGGFALVAGAGSDNPEQAQKGKQAVTAAVIGFVVVFAAYWIVRLLEALLGSQFITAPSL